MSPTESVVDVVVAVAVAVAVAVGVGLLRNNNNDSLDDNVHSPQYNVNVVNRAVQAQAIAYIAPSLIMYSGWLIELSVDWFVGWLIGLLFDWIDWQID